MNFQAEKREEIEEQGDRVGEAVIDLLAGGGVPDAPEDAEPLGRLADFCHELALARLALIEVRLRQRESGAGHAVPLGSLTAIRPRWSEPRERIRSRGEPARALFVWRAHGASSLAVDQELRRRVASALDQIEPPHRERGR